MLRIFLLTLGIYLLYRFIFDFFIPVYKASKKVHRQFQDMQQNGYTNPGPQPTNGAKKPAPDFSTPSSKDYIDFEELKD